MVRRRKKDPAPAPAPLLHDGSLRVMIRERERLGLPVAETTYRAARRDDTQGRALPPPPEERLQ